MSPDFDHPWPGRIAIAVFAALVALATQLAPPGIAIFDELLRDPLLRLTATPEAETRITVVDIDEASLAEIGPWPWPRERLADLVEILLGPLGTRGVALDMVLPEASDGPGDARLAALAAHAPLTLSVALDYLPRHPPLAQGLPGKSRRWQDGETFVAATGYVGNHALFGAARCVGNIGFLPDADGAIRRLPALSRLGEQ
ncbi:MAG: CHASE2 domain-containing protein, partial [Bacillota bacterium]|nr:CHASE2 domain-containing protein [Bacillota bacterium]